MKLNGNSNPAGIGIWHSAPFNPMAWFSWFWPNLAWTFPNNNKKNDNNGSFCIGFSPLNNNNGIPLAFGKEWLPPICSS
jgi:hypothetical protein